MGKKNENEIQEVPVIYYDELSKPDQEMVDTWVPISMPVDASRLDRRLYHIDDIINSDEYINVPQSLKDSLFGANGHYIIVNRR